MATSTTIIVEEELKAEAIRTNAPHVRVIVIKCPASKVVGLALGNTLKYELCLDYLNKQKPNNLFFAPAFTLVGEKLASDLYTFFDIDKTEKRRINITAYTPEGIENALLMPFSLDDDKVDEYIKRETANYLFAFKASPWLWSQMSNHYEKKLTLNLDQYHLFEKLVLQTETPVEYVLKAYITKLQLCFSTRLQTLNDLKECAQLLIDNEDKLVLTPLSSSELMTPEPSISLISLLNEPDINLSTQELIAAYKQLVYKGVIQNSLLMDHDVDLLPNERLLCNYIRKKANVQEAKWSITIPDKDFCLVQEFTVAATITPINFSHKLTLNAIETCLSPKNMNIISDDTYLKELELMEYKGYVSLTNNKKTFKREYEVIQYSKSSGIETLVKSVSLKTSVLQPIGFMVYMFFKDNFTVAPNTRFEIVLDEMNTCIVAKYGLVIRNTNPITNEITFLKMKESFDYKALYFNQCDLKDVITSSNGTYSKNIDGKYITLKTGKYGTYAEVLHQSKKTNISLKELGNRPLENIRWVEVMDILEKKKSNEYNKYK